MKLTVFCVSILIFLNGCCVGDDGWINNNFRLILMDNTGSIRLLSQDGPNSNSQLSIIDTKNNNQVEFELEPISGEIDIFPFVDGTEVNKKKSSNLNIVLDSIKYSFEVEYEFEDRNCSSYNAAKIISVKFDHKQIEINYDYKREFLLITNL